MKDPLSAIEWHPGPGAEELVRRKAELLVLSRQLLERERGLAAFRGELHAFETSYRKALGARYARLDELAERLDETALGDGPLPGEPDEDGDGPADRYPGQGLPGGQNWAWGEREPDGSRSGGGGRRRRQAAVPPAGPPHPSRPGRRRPGAGGAPT